jgi:sigma-B regulation protein RsbU (phosphoserine phosphatase)
MAALLVSFTDGSQRRVELSGAPITLGRSDVCDVRLPGEEVSREHAQVWVDPDGRVQVKDRGSKNGTAVDRGLLFRAATRTAANQIRIGEYDIEVVGSSWSGMLPDMPTEVRFQPPDAALDQNTSYFPSTRDLQFDLNSRRLELLMELGERIAGAFERKQVVELALEGCCETFGFERGLIVLKTQRGDTEQPVTRNIRPDETGAFPISRTLINKALVDGEPAVVNNLEVDLAGNITESMVRYPIRSALCVPIMHRDEILGVIYGDRVSQTASYTESDVGFLAAIAQQLGLGLANLRLFQERIKAERIFQELNQAREIQRDLLPQEQLVRGRYVLVGHNEPCEEVGGDYFDYFPLDDGRIGLIIADVVGHGTPAALMMATLKGAVRTALTGDAPLETVMSRLNRLVCISSGAGVFITGIVGRLDPETGRLELVNAGHPGPILLGPRTAQPLEDGLAFAMGIFMDAAYQVQVVELAGDVDGVYFFTDGLTEAEDAQAQQLGDAPVRQAFIDGATSADADTLLDLPLRLVERHVAGARKKDDLTVMLVSQKRD